LRESPQGYPRRTVRWQTVDWVLPAVFVTIALVPVAFLLGRRR
jgi:hypothetical protein